MTSQGVLSRIRGVRLSDDRDWVLMVLLAFLNLGSLITTVLGARELLPWPTYLIVGVAIQTILFTMLSGFAGQHAPLRKWLVVAVFATACVYCSFFTYYGQLQKDEDVNRQTAISERQHAAFVKAVFTEGLNEGRRLTREADELDRQAEAEASRGTTTGFKGYGPVASDMRKKANATRLAAEQHNAIVEQLEPLFEFEITGLTPKEVHTRDLEAWQRAPTAWTKGYPQPVYEDYVDEVSQVKFLAPVQRVRDGDTVAIVALLLASLVDGMAILLGTAIERRTERNHAKHFEKWVQDWTKTSSVVTGAIRTAMPGQRPGVHLHVEGEASQFLSIFHKAIHPENGHLDLEHLQWHERDTYRIASHTLARALLDAGWFTPLGDEEYAVRKADYGKLTSWFSEQIQQALTKEKRGKPTSDLFLPFPARVSEA